MYGTKSVNATKNNIKNIKENSIRKKDIKFKKDSIPNILTESKIKTIKNTPKSSIKRIKNNKNNYIANMQKIKHLILE